jgi:hypothetical protein
MAETDRNIGEEVAIADSEAAAERSQDTAAKLGLAAATVRYVVDSVGEEALAAIGRDAGVTGLTLDHLIDSAATVDAAASREQAISAGLTHDAELIREQGLPR